MLVEAIVGPRLSSDQIPVGAFTEISSSKGIRDESWGFSLSEPHQTFDYRNNSGLPEDYRLGLGITVA